MWDIVTQINLELSYAVLCLLCLCVFVHKIYASPQLHFTSQSFGFKQQWEEKNEVTHSLLWQTKKKTWNQKGSYGKQSLKTERQNSKENDRPPWYWDSGDQQKVLRKQHFNRWRGRRHTNTKHLNIKASWVCVWYGHHSNGVFMYLCTGVWCLYDSQVCERANVSQGVFHSHSFKWFLVSF